MRVSPRTDAAFTMPEILIAAIIITILAAIAIPTFFGSKDTTRMNEIKTAAGAYYQGVGAYMLDNGNQLPSSLNPTVLKDPNNKPYVVQPDVVKQGYLVLSGSGTAKSYGRLSYTHAGLAYGIRVDFRKRGKSWQTICAYGTVSGVTKRC